MKIGQIWSFTPALKSLPAVGLKVRSLDQIDENGWGTFVVLTPVLPDLKNRECWLIPTRDLNNYPGGKYSLVEDVA